MAAKMAWGGFLGNLQCEGKAKALAAEERRDPADGSKNPANGRKFRNEESNHTIATPLSVFNGVAI